MNGIPLFAVVYSKYNDFIISCILATQNRKDFIIVKLICEKFGDFKNFHISLYQKQEILML